MAHVDLKNNKTIKPNSILKVKSTGRGGGVLPYIGYIGMCGPKEYRFSAVLVMNRVWFLGSGPHTPTHFFWEYPPPPPRDKKSRASILGIRWPNSITYSDLWQRTNQLLSDAEILKRR